MVHASCDEVSPVPILCLQSTHHSSPVTDGRSNSSRQTSPLSAILSLSNLALPSPTSFPGGPPDPPSPYRPRRSGSPTSPDLPLSIGPPSLPFPVSLFPPPPRSRSIGTARSRPFPNSTESPPRSLLELPSLSLSLITRAVPM